MSTLVDQYGAGGSVDPGTLAFVQIHPWAGGSTTWGANRATFYGVTGTPQNMWDGWDLDYGGSGSYTQDYNTYHASYLSHVDDPTDVTIEMTGDPVTGQTYHITATVCVESGGSGKNMRIYIVQVLDYWPFTPTYHRNGFKQAADTVDYTFSPGECLEVEWDFTFDTDSWANQDDIKIVAWAQEPLASGPADVYQAAVMTWPFPLSGAAYDDCEDALEAGNAIYSNSTELATNDGDASCDAGSDELDVWYSYRAPADGTLEVDTCGSSFDTVLSIHTDCPGTTGNELDCNDNSDECGGGSYQSNLSVAVTEGTVYLVRLAGYDGAYGEYDVTFNGPVDVTAPTPDPMTFSAEPWAYSDDEIRMTAELASDGGSPDIEYDFDFVSGGSGGDDSGWQSSRDYVDTGLSPNTAYTYRVRARDGAANPTAYSTPSSTANTLAEEPGQPIRSNITPTTMDLTVAAAGNPSYTEFAIQCVIGAPWNGMYVDETGNPSGSAVWQTADQWGTITVHGLTSQTNYCWRVKARNMDEIETDFGSWGCSTSGIPGDIDGNGELNELDIALFTEVLLGIETTQVYIDRCKLNGDDQADGLDVQPFTEAFLS